MKAIGFKHTTPRVKDNGFSEPGPAAPHTRIGKSLVHSVTAGFSGRGAS